MRRFELNEKDTEFINNYLWCNGYASMAHDNVIISSDNEDIEVKTILDDNDIEYTESNLHPDEILLEISAQLEASKLEASKRAENLIPTARVALVSGRLIVVSFLNDGFHEFFCVRLYDSGGLVLLNVTRNCEFDELHLITDYINEILDMEDVDA